MTKVTRNTITKKMSLRDYTNLIYYFETGEPEMDLSTCDPAALAVVELRKMRLTPEEKAKMDNFFQDLPFGVSSKSIYDSIPKIGCFVAPPEQPSPAPTVATIPTEPIAPKKVSKDLPYWIKDHGKKIDASNIDAKEVIRLLESGESDLETIKNKLIDMAGLLDNPMIFLALEPCMFDADFGDRYRYCVSFLDIIEIAAKVYDKYVTIMNEPAPDEEETRDRYFAYIAKQHGVPKHPDLYKTSSGADDVTSINGNKIIFDNDDAKTLEYIDSEDMENDLFYLVNARKIGKDVQVDIFGKKVSAAKIAERFYKKHPQGLPDAGVKFYHTRREAYEDGALEL